MCVCVCVCVCVTISLCCHGSCRSRMCHAMLCIKSGRTEAAKQGIRQAPKVTTLNQNRPLLNISKPHPLPSITIVLTSSPLSSDQFRFQECNIVE